MRRRVSVMAMAMGLLAVAPGVGIGIVQAQNKPRVAVVTFRNTTLWWGAQLGASASDQLTTKLVNSGAFTVIERQRLKDVTDEQFLGQTGAVDQSKVAQLGKLLGAEYLITGGFRNFNIKQTNVGFGPARVRNTTAESAIDARAINVNTGEIVVAAQYSGSKRLGTGGVFKSTSISDNISPGTPWNPTIAEEALGEALQKIADDFSRQREKFVTNAATAAAAKAVEEKAAISGNPAIVGFAQDGGIYIDQGQNAGMTVGRRFRVVHIVDVIKDAKGNELDKVTKPIGVIEVTQVLARSSTCKVVSGTKPDPKDLLEPQ